MTITPVQLYNQLLDHFHHQDWWPIDAAYHKRHNSDPRFEIIIGAILTQNTAWTNVEKALRNLKDHNALTITTINSLDEQTLKKLIQPSGFFNQKAHRLRLFTRYLHERYQDSLTTFFTQDTDKLRHELLLVKGIGPETADSILLYAGNHLVFVVDAYTRRICTRLPLSSTQDSYDAIQEYFEHHLPEKVLVYKELHALIVMLAKNYCRKKTPLCDSCPIALFCEKRL